jgi:AbiV family abortive infection protein
MTKRLPKEIVSEFGEAACANVFAYLDDIEALEEAGRHVRAFALAVMAAEEFAKAWWADNLLDNYEDEKSWESFWASLGGRGVHQARLAVLMALERVVTIGGGTSDLVEIAGELGAAESFRVGTPLFTSA